jgi:hypothetical protein
MRVLEVFVETELRRKMSLLVLLKIPALAYNSVDTARCFIMVPMSADEPMALAE